MSLTLTASAARPGFDALRSAGPDVLSLALMEARNRTLAWVAAFESAGASGPVPAAGEGDGADAVCDATLGAASEDALLHVLGGIAWFQERWIARNVQRDRGWLVTRDAPRLAPLLPGIDALYEPGATSTHDRAVQAEALFGNLQGAREYAVQTLELTLDLLARVDADRAESDAPLAVFRTALFVEAALDEAFAVRAQTLGLGLVAAEPGGWVSAPAPRPPVRVPATRWRMGLEPPGHAFDDQRPAHVVDVPEYEIDAQPVTWAQFGEFVADGGYDEPAHWSAAGLAWRDRLGRRTPRHVEQMRHGVLQHRFGRTLRVPPQGPCVHVSWHEAEAWCRWAGRRLPAEVEWEAAAHLAAASRGFRWGTVREWTAGTWRPYPGFVPAPWRDRPAPFGEHRAWRGASFATPPALVSPRLRGHAPAAHDASFIGFRSCAA